MQLPFLQVALGEFTLVPLVAGELSSKEYADAAQALAPYLDSSTVVVASSDFTHYGIRFGYQPFKDHPRENLKKLETAPLIKSWQRISRASYPMWMKPATICGTRPIGMVLKLLPPAAKGKLLSYYTSGDLTGDFDTSVKYAAIVFTVD